MMNATLTRREWLSGAAATGLIGTAPAFAATEPPPETTRIRVADSTVLCFAPQFVAEDLLRAEGFSQIEQIKREMKT